MECVQSGALLKGRDQALIEMELTDDGFFSGTCKQGHKIVAVLQNPKYELLFDLGGLALLDGYTREAVSSFAVALERFYEFCIKLFFIDLKIDQSTYKEYWKNVSNQTERQFGCFNTAYLTLFKKNPVLLSNSDVEFRNRVTHKGYIPSVKEVFEYGNTVGASIQIITKEFIAYSKDVFMHEVFSRFQSMMESKKTDGVPISTMNIPTMLNTTHEDFVKETEFSLEKKIESMKTYRTYVYSDFRKKHIDEYNYGLLKSMFGNSL
jgi:hypothetical protein